MLQDGQNNNGYVPFVDYSRDYPPPTTPLPAGVSPVPAADSDAVDPRYSAIYGNPYLRHSVSPQLPPPPAPHTSLPPPPYNITRNAVNRNTLATHV